MSLTFSLELSESEFPTLLDMECENEVPDVYDWEVLDEEPLLAPQLNEDPSPEKPPPKEEPLLYPLEVPVELELELLLELLMLSLMEFVKD